MRTSIVALLAISACAAPLSESPSPALETASTGPIPVEPEPDGDDAATEGVADLDDGGRLTPTFGPSRDAVLKAYRFVGNPAFGATQADLGSSAGIYYRFTAARDGRLKRLLWQTQGARANWQWGDRHTGGTYGRYRWHVFKASTTPRSDIGAPGDRVAIGGNKGLFYPGVHVGGFDGLETAPHERGVQTGGVGELRGGASIHAWITQVAPTLASKVKGTVPPPAWWLGSTRYCGGGFAYVELFDTRGAPGIEVRKGDVILAHYENEDPDPSRNFSHDNSIHSPFAPVPGIGVATPLDPALGVFDARGARDFRKVPHFAQCFDGLDDCYGLSHMMARGKNYATDDQDPAGAARLVYRDRQARQVFTPPVGYRDVVSALWVQATRFTGKAGFTQDGALQARIRTAPVGTSTWTQAWPADGWATFPAGTFTAKGAVVAGARLDSREQPTSEVLRYGKLEIVPALAVTGALHYAVEVRVAPGSPRSAFYLEAMINGGSLYSRRKAVGRADLNLPQVWPAGGSGRTFNSAQASNDGGRTWSGFLDDVETFPIALEPVD